MIKETLVLAALAIGQPSVVDGDTVQIAGVSIRLTDYDSVLAQMPPRAGGQQSDQLEALFSVHYRRHLFLRPVVRGA
jgi:hypothetical protein